MNEAAEHKQTAGVNYLILHEGSWNTSMGAWFPGEKVVFRGKDYLSDLKDLPWVGLLLFAITGRIYPLNEIRMVEALHSLCGSFPEPRLWNNRIAALSGTAKSTPVMAFCGGSAASEAKIFGKQADLNAFDFICRAKKTKLEDLHTLVHKELKNKRSIGGFGRPLTTKDERIEPVLKVANDLGCDGGVHLRRVFEVEKVIIDSGRKLRANIGIFAAAICADLGMSSREYNLITTLVFSVGILACYIDAVASPCGTFFPINCQRLSYEGRSERDWEK